ncbi:hypothetical protein LCGC14_0838320 [marine sediment metagenome]|uniref:C2H2-type domain-containing protein n=1 Tax=marine sediment metagenome TaxID=412755 RepID=A0A0F9PDX6_9ZZZZ
MIKCQKCQKWFSTKKGLNIHSSRMHKNQNVQNVQVVNVNNSQIIEILNSIRKLQLDNVYLKCRVKNITGNNHTTEAIERIKMDEARPEQSGNEDNMTKIVKEMKKIFTEDFNYKNILSHVNGIETILIPIMVEAI